MINRTAAKFNSKPIIIIAVIGAIMCLCLCTIASIIGFIYLSMDTGPTIAPTAPGPTIAPTMPGPTITPNEGTGPTITPTAPVTPDLTESNPQTQTWLVLFYLDADNNLEEDMYFDLNEMEMVGSTDRVQMVAQVDRSAEYFTGDGDWTSARRYYLTQDSDLNTINSQLIADLGEVDMGNSNTLVDFATWAIQSYPADKVVLILSDHGAGWDGGWLDDSPLVPGENWILLNELESGLGQIIANTGIRQFELVGMDACLMSMLEVYNGLAPYAHYAVASEELVPGIGWAYASFLGDLTTQPEMSGADLGRSIVEGYISEDQRILNDEARQRMLGSSDPISADELAQQWGTDITLTAVDLSALPQLNASLDNFLYALKNVDQAKVAEARSYAQPFGNPFESISPSAPYIDLSNFANFVVTTTADQALSQANQQLQAALSVAVIAEKHGDQRPGATGISIHFPVSDLFWNEDYGYALYTDVTRSSASQNLWDDFLAFHYAGQDFGLGNPSREARLPAPGAGQISIALTLSANSINSGDSLNIQADITGDNVAYIYLVTMEKADCENCYIAYSTNILMVDESREQNGVFYPVYERSNGAIHLNLDSELNPFAICNGMTASNCAFANTTIENYTPQSEDLIQLVKGLYIYADMGQRVEATMYLYNRQDFELRNIIGYFGNAGEIRSPSEIIPKPGDQFMVWEEGWTIDGNGIPRMVGYREGYSLTFNDQSVFVGKLHPVSGEYQVGIMVEDMDGNRTWQFAPVTVR
jgi:hypothetical protein